MAKKILLVGGVALLFVVGSAALMCHFQRPWAEVFQVGAAVVTAEGVILALFKDTILDALSKRSVELIWGGDLCLACHIVMVGGNPPDITDAYVRIRVRNDGDRDLESLEVFAWALETREHGRWVHQTFTPAALKWMHRDDQPTALPLLPVKAELFLNIGSWNRGAVGEGTATRLCLATEVEQRFTIAIPEGEHRLLLRAMCKGGVIYESKWKVVIPPLPGWDRLRFELAASSES